MILLASASLALTFVSCSSQKAITTTPPPPTPALETKLADPNRQKGSVPGEISIMKFRPDSQKVETRDYTCFFLYDKTHSCLYVTIHRVLFEKIVGWLPEEIDRDSKNSVLLVGTMIDPFTLITPEELNTNPALKKILQLNGFKVFAIFNYAHYPKGVSEDVLAETRGQSSSAYPTQFQDTNQNQGQTTSPPPVENSGRKVYKP